MSKQIITTPDAPRFDLPLSQAVRVDNLIFVSGQVGADPKTGRIVEGIEAQVRLALENTKAILASANASLENVAKANVYLKDIRDFDKMNAEYRKYFPANFPARTTTQAVMAFPEILVEIDTVAVLKPR